MRVEILMCSAEKWVLEGLDSDSAFKNRLPSVPWSVLSCPGGKNKLLLSLRSRTEGDTGSCDRGLCTSRDRLDTQRQMGERCFQFSKPSLLNKRRKNSSHVHTLTSCVISAELLKREH